MMDIDGNFPVGREILDLKGSLLRRQNQCPSEHLQKRDSSLKTRGRSLISA
jgi:hypothetical protein